MIPKGGDRLDPAQYRPITLLNTDYRILTRAMASRLQSPMQHVIGQQQSAFLPGRSIGDGIRALQFLPSLASGEQRMAAVVLSDISKAYDTVDRPFLQKAMAAFGVGPAFCQLVLLLLSNTRARVSIGGFMSRPAHFAAGVR